MHLPKLLTHYTCLPTFFFPHPYRWPPSSPSPPPLSLFLSLTHTYHLFIFSILSFCHFVIYFSTNASGWKRKQKKSTIMPINSSKAIKKNMNNNKQNPNKTQWNPNFLNMADKHPSSVVTRVATHYLWSRSRNALVWPEYMIGEQTHRHKGSLGTKPALYWVMGSTEPMIMQLLISVHWC